MINTTAKNQYPYERMGFIEDLPKSGDIKVSFEFFPPKTEKAEESLWDCIMQLSALQPAFVSVTYGAGGSTRKQTRHTVQRIAQETLFEAAAHLTCVNASKAEIHDIADEYWQMGIRHLVALRGDMPDNKAYTPQPDGYAYASNLVEGLMERHDFEISVAAHPEGHPESPNLQQDIDNLKRKQDAGAKRAITQFFFDNENFLRYRDLAQKNGVTLDIIPGILPVTNFERLQQLAALCQTHIPDWAFNLFDGLDTQIETRRMIANIVAAAQVMELWKNGVDHFHFYTLNRPLLTQSLCHLLNVRAHKEVSI